MKHFVSLLVVCALPACGSSTPGDALGGGGGPASPVILAVSPGGIFFIDDEDDTSSTATMQTTTLDRIPLAGGDLTALLSTARSPTSLALDATSAYVLDLAGVEQIPQAGGTATTLVPTSALTGTPTSLTVLAGGALAWFELDPNATSGQIMVRPAPQSGTPVAPMPVVMNLLQPCALAADTANLYWLDCSTSQLGSLPLTGIASATPTVLAMNLALTTPAPGPTLVAAGGSVFWTTPGSGAIHKLPAAGGTPVTLTAGAGQIASGLATDGTELYWLTQPDLASGTDTVWKMPTAGGTPTEVLSPDQDSQGGYGPIAIDASYLYFWDNDHATIRRLAR